MSKSTKKYIYKLLESAKKIEEIADKENFSSFLSPKAWIIRDAVARRFLIIASVSEILFNKHMEFCMKYPEIPFSAMQGMKRYLTEIQDGDIDWAIVWQTTQEKIHELIKHCDEVISDTASLDL